MSIVLTNQIEASEKSVHQLEQQVDDHRLAMTCHDVEALMEQIIAMRTDLNHYIERWQAEIEKGTLPYDRSAADALLDLYVRLEKTASKTARLGQKLEACGFAVAGKPQFLNTWRQMKGVVCFSPDRVAESFSQIRAGQTKSLGDFTDELSRRVD